MTPDDEYQKLIEQRDALRKEIEELREANAELDKLVGK